MTNVKGFFYGHGVQARRLATVRVPGGGPTTLLSVEGRRNQVTMRLSRDRFVDRAGSLLVGSRGVRLDSPLLPKKQGDCNDNR